MNLRSEAAAHGGLRDAELAHWGISAESVLDFSVNVNPYGPCLPLMEVIQQAPLDRYPDPEAHLARRTLAEALQVPSERVVLGNGAAELLWLLARVWLARGRTFGTVEPTFSEMRRAAQRQGAECVSLRLDPAQEFRFDLGEFERFLKQHAPHVVYLCSPGNPHGQHLPLEALTALAPRYPGTHFVVDLSFDSLSDLPQVGLERHSEHLTWVRSLTKDLALPGLRLGYGVMAPALAAELEAERPPWSVNAAAQAAVRAAASDPRIHDFVTTSRERLRVDRLRLANELERLGLSVHPSLAPYVLVDLGPGRSASALRQRLLTERRVLVRDATSFGLPHHIRIAARPWLDQTERLRAALAAAL